MMKQMCRDIDANNCSLIVNYDANGMWGLQLTCANRDRKLDADAVKALLEEVVDEHAKAKVDRIVHCIFGFHQGRRPRGWCKAMNWKYR